MKKINRDRINSFDLADYISCLHKKKNIPLSLCKLQAIIFFYQVVSKTTHVIPFIDDDFFIKNNFIYLKDIDKKYKKEKKDVTQKERFSTKKMFTEYGSICKLLTALTEHFRNRSDISIRNLVKKIPTYQKNKKGLPSEAPPIRTQNEKEEESEKAKQTSPACRESIIEIRRQDFKKYYPLKTWEDAYNMIIEIDNTTLSV